MKKPPSKCEVAFSQICLARQPESSVSLDQVNLLDDRPERLPAWLMGEQLERKDYSPPILNSPATETHPRKGELR